MFIVKNLRFFFLICLITILGCDEPSREETVNYFDLARKGELNKIKEIVERNPTTLDSVNNDGYTMLILACYHNRIKTSKYLIKKTTDVDYMSKSGTALMAAIVRGDLEIIESFLKKKVNLDLVDSNGKTALTLAVQMGRTEVATTLLRAGANPRIKDKTGETAISYAIQNRDTVFLKRIRR